MATLHYNLGLNSTGQEIIKCMSATEDGEVEFIFSSALADSTPKQLVSCLKYWISDEGIPLIENGRLQES